MGEFEETIIVIGIIIGTLALMGFIAWSSASARSYYDQENPGETERENSIIKKWNKKQRKEKEDDEKIIATDDEPVLPKGFKKDTD